MDYHHVPVLLMQTVDGLKVRPDGIYLDGTLGGAGHAEDILKRLDTGKLIANDFDEEAIENGKERLKKYGDKVIFIRGDFKDVCEKLDEMGIEKLDGAVFDLGVSSHQIDTAERGFSYVKDAPLDMRMDQDRSLTAKIIVNEYSEKELSDIFFTYGEERLAKKIARRIVERRKVRPIEGTIELAELVWECYPPKERYRGGNPAKRVFQSLRIAVNGELDGLKEFLIKISLRLKPGGRLACISFHSLEDRAVKQAFKELETDCVCDKRTTPVCVCGKRSEALLVTPKPILGKTEDKENPRAESAKLRILERK